MLQADFNKIFERQKTIFWTGKTQSYSFRIKKLKKLKALLSENEEQLLEALKEDLGKGSFEAWASEIFVLQQEIDIMINQLKDWMSVKRIPTPVLHWPSKSYIIQEARGICLIMAPWNYPVQLLLSPLAGAIAGGNCCILKPSELAPACSALLAKLVTKYFKQEYVYIIEGGIEKTQSLLKLPFDHIFFTGSTEVGKIVMKAASKHLSHLTLELGGKSPCVLDTRVNLKQACRKICWGKFFNAGQTCIAPDYILVHEAMKEEFLEQMKKTLIRFYGENPERSEHYARIINEKHFDRLSKHIDKEKVFYGGVYDKSQKYISPTILHNIEWDDPVMSDEIFGPLLPVLTYKNPDDAILMIRKRGKPLALYIFSRNRNFQKTFETKVQAGGICINDTLSHITNHKLPFGGTGYSGMGSYHGRYSFKEFTHAKSVMRKSFLTDFSLRYPPYRKLSKGFKRMIRFIS